jgi:hypothetical protein
MNISTKEAMSLLDSWKNGKTSLKVHCSRYGVPQDIEGVIEEIRQGRVLVSSDSRKLQIDLEGAEFNGDNSAPASSSYESYLICEFRDGDRCSFHAFRARRVDTSTP